METQLQEYENREFIIFNVSELNQIDFTQVLETSIDTVRKSVDQTKTFVKWDGIMPECVNNLTTKDPIISPACSGVHLSILTKGNVTKVKSPATSFLVG